MHLHSIIAGVGLVAATNALLLPPDFPIADDAVTTLPVPTAIDVDAALSMVPDTQVVDLECPGCLRSHRKHQKEIPSHLKLDFSIESNEGPDRLLLNGYELYPNPDFLQDTLKAPLLPNMASRHVGAAPRLRGGPNRPQANQPLGFAMETGEVTVEDNENLQLINVEIQIIEVGDAFVQGIPNVQVKLVKTPTGKLAIGTIDITRFQEGDSPNKKECSTTVCKWKALFFAKLSKIFSLEGCNGSRPPPPPPHGHHDHHGHHDGEHRYGHGPPSHHPPHPHHMGHRHGWAHGLRIIVTHVLFPIMIGIVAGVLASLIGMMVGTFIVFLFRLFFRRSAFHSSHRCRYAHKTAKHESAADEEKSGLLNDQEDVEAPPAYMDSNVVVAEDKKAENEV
ncbi:hypothetical protein E0Z10_g4118 [Xylaria hypoxylon]|uniref:DUF7728 domain-containing protein n=1 Tax=Xylaria hypoxylon TaxID=37992 RepID=A0A4Z0YK55_9PEZI|nr:hypothetical protein E0Z10_g4118 [Xylaria hypoxylon]